MSKVPFITRLAVIGVGLIGGSLALALKRMRAVGEVIGCGRNAADLEKGVTLGVIDRYSTDPIHAVRDADVVMLATPIGAMRSLFEKIRDHLAPETVVTDAGSAKANVIADARTALGARFADFVPGHPIAGTEKSGVEAGFADLYSGHRVILCPQPETRMSALSKVQRMWELVGAQVEQMDAVHHDVILARTSHLPHLVAYALADVLAATKPQSEVLRFAAGGFRDLTRVASSPPVMWRDIALANREALLTALDEYLAALNTIRAAVAAQDAAALEKIFARAKALRDSLPPRK
ncbi:MAG TPA: prephenate dehydrogenase/arogenate dehydrogenase family protein [Gammaproteobacteria bacterium]|nr:prephenate dehydrogenase/arogenate dehydrogenase family protein [Gammaproteobacteria bacterium]